MNVWNTKQVQEAQGLVDAISNGAALYKFTNPNNKIYIGITKDLRGRFAMHFKANSPIGKSLRKHGPKNHKIDILLTGPRKLISKMEQIFIEDCGSVGNQGLNSTSGGDNGYTFTEETRDKIRQAHTGRVMPQEVREKIGNANRGKKKPKFSEEHRKKLSDAKRGKLLLQEHRDSIFLAMNSPETRKRMSEGQKNRASFTDEHREKLRQAAKRQWASGGNTQQGDLPCK